MGNYYLNIIQPKQQPPSEIHRFWAEVLKDQPMKCAPLTGLINMDTNFSDMHEDLIKTYWISEIQRGESTYEYRFICLCWPCIKLVELASRMFPKLLIVIECYDLSQKYVKIGHRVNIQNGELIAAQRNLWQVVWSSPEKPVSPSLHPLPTITYPDDMLTDLSSYLEYINYRGKDPMPPLFTQFISFDTLLASEVCQKCNIANMGKWTTNAEDNILLMDYFERQWNEGLVMCPHCPNFIFDESKCPYLLEHTVNQPEGEAS